MKNKALVGALLTLLSVCMSTLVFNSQPSCASSIETYNVSISPTWLTGYIGYINLLIPPDSSVISFDLLGTYPESVNVTDFRYLGTFNLRCYKFAQASVEFGGSDVDPRIDARVQVSRNSSPYVPCSADPLADEVMNRLVSCPRSGNVLPLLTFGNLENANEWRGYPILSIQKNTGYTLPQQTVDYLVVTSNDVKPLVDPLLDWKETQGFVTYAMTTQSIDSGYVGDSLELKVREFLKDAFNTWHMEYVLIVGGSGVLPPISYNIYNHTLPVIYPPYTDYYYMTLEQSPDTFSYEYMKRQAVDFPDFVLGRFPLDSPQQIESLVNKTISYEQLTGHGEWARTNLLIHGQDAPGGPSGAWNQYTNDNRTKLRLISPYNLTVQTMVDALNEGVGSVYINAHGYPSGWKLNGTEYFRYDDVDGLYNSRLPVIFSSGCHTGRFDVGVGGNQSLPVQFLEKSNGGAVAYVSGTDYSPNAYWVYFSAYNYWNNCPLEDWRIPNADYNLGKAFFFSTALNTVTSMILFGDPAIDLSHLHVPEQLRVPENYSTIQSAINAAYFGDTVLVSTGTYCENIVVDKSVALCGTGAGNTIIDGNLSGNAINITAPLVVIQGLTIRTAGALNSGICVSSASYNNTLSNNRIENNYNGILLDSSSNNTISRNNVTNNIHGMYLTFSPSNNLLENNITANEFGITLYASNNNTLKNNQMNSNGQNFGLNTDWNLSRYINDVDVSNTVDGRPIYYLISKKDFTIPSDAGYVALVNCTRITVQNLHLSHNLQGVLLAFTNNSIVTKNSLTGCFKGIELSFSANNTLTENSIISNNWGIFLYYSTNNTSCKNDLQNSYNEIFIMSSSNNTFHSNNINNTNPIYLYGVSNNIWDAGYPSWGNYWSDYADVDVCSGPKQSDPGSDGVWDHPYVIDAENQDRYPLVNPWVPIETCLVVRGMDNRIYYRTWNGIGWAGWTSLPGATCDSPAAVVCNNELHIVVRGSDGYSLWHGYVNLADDTFHGWMRLSGSTPSAPTLASNGSALCLVVRGGDNRIYCRTHSFSPRGWGSWNVLSSGSTCDGPAAAMLGSNLHMVVRGMDGSSLWNIIVEPDVDVVRGWVRISGSTLSKPSLATNQTANKLYLIVRGMDNMIYWRTYDGLPTDSWGGWNVVPTGSTCDGPGAAVAGNKLHVAVRGMDGSTLWHRDYDFSTATYSNWTKLSGATPSPPTLAN